MIIYNPVLDQSCLACVMFSTSWTQVQKAEYDDRAVQMETELKNRGKWWDTVSTLKDLQTDLSKPLDLDDFPIHQAELEFVLDHLWRCSLFDIRNGCSWNLGMFWIDFPRNCCLFFLFWCFATFC